MSKLFTGKIDVTKIDKVRLFKGEKGTYLDLVIWINEETDKYGNTMSIQQHTAKGDDKIYLGNCKVFEQSPNVESEQQKEESDDLPF